MDDNTQTLIMERAYQLSSIQNLQPCTVIHTDPEKEELMIYCSLGIIFSRECTSTLIDLVTPESIVGEYEYLKGYLDGDEDKEETLWECLNKIIVNR